MRHQRLRLLDAVCGICGGCAVGRVEGSTTSVPHHLRFGRCLGNLSRPRRELLGRVEAAPMSRGTRDR